MIFFSKKQIKKQLTVNKYILNVTIYRRWQQQTKDGGFGLRFNTATDGEGRRDLRLVV